MNISESYYYPNRMGRIILQAMEEVIGRNGVNAILKLSSHAHLIENYPPDDAALAFPFSTMSNLNEMLEQAYGPHGGRGLALRVGRACFNAGLRQYGTQLGITEMAFRLLPLPAKIHAGAKALAHLFNTYTDQRVRIEEGEGVLFWHIERCPLCWQRQAAEPVCHLAVGVLQEALYWLSGGKVFIVEEKTCIAVGDSTCTIAIDQTPIT
ncbi:MAG TPA: 4-vinyl reductase [Anaerolineales bacterium]|nr:4-vinyl reductase [Anaerolineales bacterium]